MNYNTEIGSKVAIVTGATGAIGKAIARQIAGLDSFNLVLVGRDEDKTRMAMKDIIAATGNQKVRCEQVDLSSQASIRALAERWEGPLDVLINNAAAVPRKRQETPEGIELQFATNVLGYFWMTHFFSEVLKRSAPSRVVNVASTYAGDLDLNDLEFKRRRYNIHTAYRQSKQANRMLTVAFAERLKPFGVSVNACHPGVVPSKLSRDMGAHGSDTPDEGARTPVWLATSPLGRTETGKFFSDMGESFCRFCEDEQAIERLYIICTSY
jgi:NAD(P)-dependent dehydrogenase (short-subunit alcohol dehydrogenase family)